MIIRPSTPQILRDLADELNREIMPLMPDTTAQIRVHMIMAVLSQAAVRAGEEIAVMREEIAAYAAYVTAVAEATDRDDVRGAAAAVTVGDDLHLDAVSAEYARAGDALGTAIEAALDAGDAALIERGEALLRERITNEQRMAGVASVGR